MTGGEAPGRAVNVAMVITIARTPLPLLFPALAWLGLRWWFVALVILIWLLDWVDGKLARLLDERTRLGARLDSLGDALLFGAMIPSLWWLRPEFLRDDWVFIGAATGSYALAVAASLFRFRRPPSYHTLSAKACGALMVVGAIILFAGGSAWPVRLALVAVTCANIESILITLSLRDIRTDVPSIFHALRLARPRARTDAAEGDGRTM